MYSSLVHTGTPATQAICVNMRCLCFNSSCYEHTHNISIRHNNTGQVCYVVETIPDSFQRLALTASWLCGFDLHGEKRALMGYQRADTRLHSGCCSAGDSLRGINSMMPGDLVHHWF